MLDIEQLKKDLSQYSSTVGSFWKPKVGRNYIRVLPPWKPETHLFYKPVRLHWVGSRSVLCTPGNCIVCSMLQDPVLAPSLEGKINTINRFLVNVVDLEDKGSGVHVWAMPPILWNQFAQFCIDPQWGDLTDARTGRNVTIVREGSGIKSTKYQIIPDPQQTEIEPQLLAQMHDLDKVYSKASPEYIISLMRDESIDVAVAPLGSQQPTPVPQQSQAPVPQQSQAPVPQQPQAPVPQQPTQPQTLSVPQQPTQPQTSQTGFDPQKVKDALNRLMGQK